MTNAFYNATGVPGPKAFGSSAAIRSEFAAIGEAFDLFPSSFTGKGGFLMRLNTGATEFELVDPLALENLFLPVSGGVVTGDIALGGRLNVGALTVVGSGHKAAFAGPIVFDYRNGINGIAGSNLTADVFTTDTNKVLSAFGLSWKTFSDAASAPSAALSGYGGIRLYTLNSQRFAIDANGRALFGAGLPSGHPVTVRGASPTIAFDVFGGAGGTWAIGANFVSGIGDFSLYHYASGAERLRVNVAGQFAFNPAGRNQVGDYNFRADRAGNGPSIVLSNTTPQAGVARFGQILFENYRDVASPVFGAGIWAEGISPAGYSSDLCFGTSFNGSAAASPPERLRIRYDGMVGINNPTPSYRLDVRDDRVGGGALHLYGVGVSQLCSHLDANGSGISNADPHGGGVLYYMLNQEARIYTSNVLRFAVNANGVFGQDGYELGYKGMPRNTSFGVQGQVSAISSNVTLNAGIPVGWAGAIYNDSASALSIFQGGGLTVRLAGTTSTGTRTIAPRGFMSLWANSAGEYIVSGPGVS